MNYSSKVVRCKCIACGEAIPSPNPHMSSMGLCRECQAKSPGSWRVVYDREKRIGAIPRNLNR
ncbi:MAG TPA: hypothetical protein VMU41_13235 [Candidatus Binataceae bacterium]|nr:hypothetical protein [Candidatus Binataceae bacterium]